MKSIQKKHKIDISLSDISINLNVIDELSLLLNPGEKIIVAFSGGGDSTATLLLLKLLEKKYSLTIFAFYYQHNIRSIKESRIERSFVSNFCNSFNIPLFEDSALIGEIEDVAKKEGRSLEELARVYRFKSLNKVIKKHSINRYATGHHSDDFDETLIMRFFQGSSPFGLVGLIQSDNFLIRPLLNQTKNEIILWLEENSIPYLTDKSNKENRFLRNKIRNELIPHISSIFPGYHNSLLKLSTKMKDSSTLLDKTVASKLNWRKVENINYKIQVEASFDEFNDLPLFLKVHSIFNSINEFFSVIVLDGQRIPYSMISSSFSGFKRAQRNRVYFEWRTIICEKVNNMIVIKQGCLNSDTKSVVFNSKIDSSLFFSFGPVKYKIEILSDTPKEGCGIWFPLSLCEDEIVIRSRKSSDIIKTEGGSKKIKKLLNEWGIVIDERDNIPIIECQHDILGVLASKIGGRDALSKKCIVKNSAKIDKWVIVKPVE